MVALELPATRVLDPALRAPTPSLLGLAAGLTPAESSVARRAPNAGRPWRALAAASLAAAALIVAWATLIDHDRAVLDTSTTEIVNEPPPAPAPLAVGASAAPMPDAPAVGAAPSAGPAGAAADRETADREATQRVPPTRASATPAAREAAPTRAPSPRESAPREPEPRRAPAASAHAAALRRASVLLAAARAEPTAQRTSEAARAILIAAERVGDTEARTSIQRIAQTAGMVGDLSSLEDAYQELDRALTREATTP
jgi:hypothetical protein